MSPERVNPGRAAPTLEEVPLEEIPKVVSALSPIALQKIQEAYSEVFDKVVPVSSPRPPRPPR